MEQNYISSSIYIKTFSSVVVHVISLTNEIEPRFFVVYNCPVVTVTSECCVKRVICYTWTAFRAGALANSANPDRTPQNMASDQCLHYLLNYRKLSVK